MRWPSNARCAGRRRPTGIRPRTLRFVRAAPVRLMPTRSLRRRCGLKRLRDIACRTVGYARQIAVRTLPSLRSFDRKIPVEPPPKATMGQEDDMESEEPALGILVNQLEDAHSLLLSILTDAEMRDLIQWIATVAELDADASFESWPAWQAVKNRLKVDMTSAHKSTDKLIVKLNKDRNQ